ncbi:unnamed protein product, partial [Allacma fusca]
EKSPEILQGNFYKSVQKQIAEQKRQVETSIDDKEKLFNDNLIFTVCVRSFTYDPEHPDHDSKKLVSQSWTDISKVDRPERLVEAKLHEYPISDEDTSEHQNKRSNVAEATSQTAYNPNLSLWERMRQKKLLVEMKSIPLESSSEICKLKFPSDLVIKY